MSGIWLLNKTSVTYWLTVFTAALVGARKVVDGLVLMHMATFSIVIRSFDNDTRAFRFKRCICLFVGRPIRNEAKQTNKHLLIIFSIYMSRYFAACNAIVNDVPYVNKMKFA